MFCNVLAQLISLFSCHALQLNMVWQFLFRSFFYIYSYFYFVQHSLWAMMMISCRERVHKVLHLNMLCKSPVWATALHQFLIRTSLLLLPLLFCKHTSCPSIIHISLLCVSVLTFSLCPAVCSARGCLLTVTRFYLNGIIFSCRLVLSQQFPAPTIYSLLRVSRFYICSEFFSNGYFEYKWKLNINKIFHILLCYYKFVFNNHFIKKTTLCYIKNNNHVL